MRELSRILEGCQIGRRRGWYLSEPAFGERLATGDESRVTHAIRRVKANRDQDLLRCRRQLEPLSTSEEDRTIE